MRPRLAAGSPGPGSGRAEEPPCPGGCALPSPRLGQVDLLKRLHPALRKLVWRLPNRLRPAAKRSAFVLGFDGAGTVTHDLQGDGEAYHYVTGVREHDGRLYLGSLAEHAIARVPLAG